MIEMNGPTSVHKNSKHDTNPAITKPKETKALATKFDAFLQLLVTQLKHQDPLKPMDPTQTVTQLATFASVEQSVQANAHLSGLSARSELSQASDLVGRHVIAADGGASGVIKAVKTGPDGLAAFLQDGNVIPLTPGVTIGEK